MNKTIASMLMFLALIVVLSACSSNCKSGTEIRSGNLATGRKQADAITAKLCTDKTDYNKGDIIHITFTVKNLLDEQIVLDGGQQPVMDICVLSMPCLSQYQTDLAQFTRLSLDPGQSHTIQWDWPLPGTDLSDSIIDRTNVASVDGKWIGLDKGQGIVNVHFFYGPRAMVP